MWKTGQHPPAAMQMKPTLSWSLCSVTVSLSITDPSRLQDWLLASQVWRVIGALSVWIIVLIARSHFRLKLGGMCTAVFEIVRLIYFTGGLKFSNALKRNFTGNLSEKNYVWLHENITYFSFSFLITKIYRSLHSLSLPYITNMPGKALRT